MQNNFLSPLNFELVIPDAETFCNLVQRVIIPDLSLGTTKNPTPHIDYPTPGKLQYGQLTVMYKHDENLLGYLEIFDWMRALSHPNDFEEYNRKNVDITVRILNSNKRPNKYIRFTDCFPINHSTIELETTDTSVNYVEGSVTFAFSTMSVHKST